MKCAPEKLSLCQQRLMDTDLDPIVESLMLENDIKRLSWDGNYITDQMSELQD